MAGLIKRGNTPIIWYCFYSGLCNQTVSNIELVNVQPILEKQNHPKNMYNMEGKDIRINSRNEDMTKVIKLKILKSVFNIKTKQSNKRK